MASRHVIVLLLLVVLLPPLVGCGAGEESGEAEADPERVRSPGPESTARFAPRGPFEDQPIPAAETPLFERVDGRARRMARSPYVPPPSLPRTLSELTYDQYRSIRFRPEAAIWRDRGPFEVQLFHPGAGYEHPVTIHLVEGDSIRTLEFHSDRFRYDDPGPELEASVSAATGHAGFRIHYPLNDEESKDEVAVFLGASYFRLLGPGQVHGLSARGVAVDTGSPRDEEFPAFREFWLVRPEGQAGGMTFYALLDGPSLTGAYRFDLDPGEGGTGTVMDMDARLYARADVEKLGVAPLTSMFLFGPNNAGSFDDYRPRVHDSHGLLARTGRREWIWRPLSNHRVLRVSSLRDVDPAGFGLVQRRRDFDAYLDLEARYDRRPSKWVTVEEGHWGTGGVELVEIPTDSEFNDNIVAYWTPDAPFRAGEGRYYRYRLETFDHRLDAEELAHVERTRIGWDALPGATAPPPRSRRRFVVDFAHDDGIRGEEEQDWDVGTGEPVRAVLTTTAGEISDRRVRPLPERNGWRVTFRVDPEADRPADMRLHLERGGEAVTETWSYVWYPGRVSGESLEHVR